VKTITQESYDEIRSQLTESTTMFGEDDNNTCFCAVFGMVNMAEEHREKTEKIGNYSLFF
jgi:hypothetical protein